MPSTLRGALRVLPAPLRDRYTEQWAGELRDADEIGLDRREIVRGAWRFALLARFAAHGAEPLELERQSWVLARWGGALIGTGALGSTVGWVGMGGGASLDAAARAHPLLVLLLAAPLILSLLCALGGALLSVGALLRRPSVRAGSVLLALALAAGGLLVASWPAQIAFSGSFDPLALIVGVTLLIVGSIVAAVVVESAPLPMRRPVRRVDARSPRVSSLAAVVAGVLGAGGAIAFGAVEGLVWGPLDQTEGAFALDEVYAALLPTERSMAVVSVASWAALGFAAALALPVIRSRMRRRGDSEGAMTARLAPLVLLVIGGIVFLQGWATFGIGMAIADTLPPFAGSRSLAWAAYAAVGTAAGLVGVLLGLAPRASSGPAAPQPARLTPTEA